MSNIEATLRAGGGHLARSIRADGTHIGAILKANHYGGAVYQDYAGSYDITPLITAQTLPTADKHMTDNVLVRMIPTSEIANSAGGITFTVGG